MTAPTGDAVLAELKITAQLVKQNQTQEKLKSVQNEYLVNGYTSAGQASMATCRIHSSRHITFRSCSSQKMAVGESDLEEMMKGATIPAKRLLEELAAYRINKRAPMSSRKLVISERSRNQQEADVDKTEFERQIRQLRSSREN